MPEISRFYGMIVKMFFSRENTIRRMSTFSTVITWVR